jgi:hypothetical protein
MHVLRLATDRTNPPRAHFALPVPYERQIGPLVVPSSVIQRR